MLKRTKLTKSFRNKYRFQFSINKSTAEPKNKKAKCKSKKQEAKAKSKKQKAKAKSKKHRGPKKQKQKAQSRKQKAESKKPKAPRIRRSRGGVTQRPLPAATHAPRSISRLGHKSAGPPTSDYIKVIQPLSHATSRGFQKKI